MKCPTDQLALPGQTAAADRYEELRRIVLGADHQHPRGLALFLRRGMYAWMEAWSRCAHSKVRTDTDNNDAPTKRARQVDVSISTDPVADEASARPLLPEDAQTEVVQLLAGMALSVWPESEVNA